MVDRSSLERFIILKQAAQQLRQDAVGVMRLIESRALRAAILSDNVIGVNLTGLRAPLQHN